MSEEISIEQWVERCMEAEEDRGASASSVAESGRQLRRAGKAFSKGGIEDVSLTPLRLRDYVLSCRQHYGPPTIKSIVWSLRKFGNFLVVQQALTANPAADLHYPGSFAGRTPRSIQTGVPLVTCWVPPPARQEMRQAGQP